MDHPHKAGDDSKTEPEEPDSSGLYLAMQVTRRSTPHSVDYQVQPGNDEKKFDSRGVTLETVETITE